MGEAYVSITGTSEEKFSRRHFLREPTFKLDFEGRIMTFQQKEKERERKDFLARVSSLLGIKDE